MSRSKEHFHWSTGQTCNCGFHRFDDDTANQQDARQSHWEIVAIDDSESIKNEYDSSHRI